MRVTVVGGGVIGLTCAVALTRAGHAVSVLSADDPAGTTSAVAAALWFPYEAAPADEVLRWGARSLQVFAELAEDPRTGVALRPGLVRVRAPEPDLGWTAVVPGAERVADGVRCVLPVIEMDRYLAWLAGQVAVERRWVERVEDLDGLVVLAAGLGANALTTGADLAPIRGQVARLANPGLTEWIVDDDHPDGLTYVVPRSTDVVCGGTVDRGATDRTVDPAAEAAILRRAVGLLPELAGQPVLSRGVGLRPARHAVRLERDGDVIHCYGHGGAGVTLSWGCAEDVVALAGG